MRKSTTLLRRPGSGLRFACPDQGHLTNVSERNCIAALEVLPQASCARPSGTLRAGRSVNVTFSKAENRDDETSSIFFLGFHCFAASGTLASLTCHCGYSNVQ